MKLYTFVIKRGCLGNDYVDRQESPVGKYVAYDDVQAMHQLLRDLIVWHENDDCPASPSDQEEIINKLIERARQLTETSHT